MPVTGANVVIDISHYQTITNLQSVWDDGVRAVIHKATEGSRTRDKEYQGRREKFKEKGFKWGSYHFSSGSPALLQVQNYLDYAQPTPDEFICLDFEPSSSGADMTYDLMIEFVEMVHQALGRYPAIYGGSMLRDAVSGKTSPILAQCPLWYARYAGNPIGVPTNIWPSWTLWQYTDGNVGPEPHKVKGIGNSDRDTYNGTAANLLTQWPFT